MPRPPRPDLPDSWYHVMNRGADRQDIFGRDADYLRFEELLGDSVDQFAVQVHAYCLMTNHFHLLVHCPSGGVSAAMQMVQRQYTQWYNARYLRDGPLYRGRFHSVRVTTDEQITTLGRYIHRNPTALMPARALSAYRWSSLGAYAGRRVVESWLTTTRLLEPFGADRSRYRSFVETELPTDGPANRSARHVTTLDTLVSAVTHAATVHERVVRTSVRGAANPSRLVAIALAVELRVAPLSELVTYFGVGSAASLRNLARRGRIAIDADPPLAALRCRVLGELFSGELLRGA